MRAEGPNHYPYTLGMALNQYKIDTEAHYLHYITKPLFNNILKLYLWQRRVYRNRDRSIFQYTPAQIYVLFDRGNG